MYWTDFESLVRRHALRPQSILFIKQDGTPSNIRTIFDLDLSRRKGLTQTGRSYEDLLRDSIICNVGFFNGDVPNTGWEGETHRDTARGAKSALKLLLEAGSIRPSKELSNLLEEDCRGRCPSDTRLYYE